MSQMDTPPKLKTILFDFDGTLIDASEVICQSFNHALGSIGMAPLPDDVIRFGIGRPLREIFLEHVREERLEEVLQAYREEFFRISLSGSRLIPGVRTLVPKLARDYRLGIVTSRTSGSVRLLTDHFGLTQFFGSVIGIAEVRKSKPAAEPILQALSELETEPAQAAMVGDTIHDILAARAAGTLAVGVASGAHSRSALLEAGAVRVLESVAGLPEFLASESLD